MPSSIALAIGAIFEGVLGSAAAASVGLAVVSGVTSLVSGLVISAASTALLSRKQPNQSNLENQVTPTIKDPGMQVSSRQAIAPHRLIYGEARVGGTIVFMSLDTVGGEPTRFLNIALILAAHPCEAIDAIYFDDYALQLDADGQEIGRYMTADGTKAWITKHLGTVGDYDSRLNAYCPDLWTVSHRLDGRTWLYVRVAWDRDVWPTGLPNITAKVRGRKVYDPRSTLTAYSANAALCVADYLASAYGWGAAYGTEIDTTALIAAANICDEDIALAAGGTENRYECHGTLTADIAPRQAIAALLTSMAGKAVYVGGTWRLIAGAYTAPTVTLTESDIRAPIRIQSRLPRREICNRVRGVYLDSAQDYQPVDFPPVTNATYLAEDGNEEIWRDIELPFCTSSAPARAQRLAKIELEKTRQQIVVTLPCKLSAYRVQAGDTVALTLARMGWTAKVFEVIGTRLAFEADGTVGADLTLRETAAAVYTWSAEETTRDPAPDTVLPDPFSQLPVTNLVAVSGEDQLVRLNDGTVQETILATWSAAPGFTADYEVTVDPHSTQASWTFSTTGTSARIFGVAGGSIYTIAIRARSLYGVLSPYTFFDVEAAGKELPPADITSFTITDRLLSWAAIPVLDVAGYRLRYQSGRNTSWGNAIPLHTGLVTSAPFALPIVPAGQITLMIKAVDFSGNESANPAVIVTNFGDALTDNVVLTTDFEALGWAGTLTGGTIGTGQIEADAPSLMWSTTGKDMWGASTALMWLGTYSAMSYTDALAVAATESGARMTLSYTASGESIALYWRPMGQAPMWVTVDTELLWGDAAALMWQVPDFAPWPGEAVATVDSYEFRIDTGGGATQGIVSAFSVSLDVPDIVERFNDVAIGAGGTRLALTNTYRVVRNVLLTLQDDGGSAATVKALDKDAAAGPLVQCFNTSGTGVTGLIDATIQGY